MRPSYRPHRHQPAPGLKPGHLGADHKGKHFRDNQTLETLRIEVENLKPNAKERAALNTAVLRNGQPNPSMMDELDRLLGTKRRGGLDSLVVLMFKLKTKLPLDEGKLPEWPQDRLGVGIVEVCLALAFLALVFSAVTATGVSWWWTLIVMAAGAAVGLAWRRFLQENRRGPF